MTTGANSMPIPSFRRARHSKPELGGELSSPAAYQGPISPAVGRTAVEPALNSIERTTGIAPAQKTDPRVIAMVRRMEYAESMKAQGLTPWLD